MACLLAGSPMRPFASKASAVSLPPLPLRLLLAGATVARWESHPLKNDAFPRRTVTHFFSSVASFFQRCQLFPALPAFSSVARFFQRCQLFPALPAFSSVASFFQRCQLFPALPAFSTIDSGFFWPSARERRRA